MLKLLKELDQFGVVFQPKIKYSTDQYKTYWGGIMSVLLYGLSFTYLIYIFVQWRTGQILPKITAQQMVQEEYKLSMNETYIEMHLRQYNYTVIDPFDPQAIVLQPALYIIKNGVPMSGFQPVQYTIESTNGQFNRLSISNLSITISQIKNEENPEFEYLLAFGDCQDNLLKPGQKCADNATVAAFYAQATNTMVVKQFVKEFSTISKQIETIPRETLIPIQQTSTYYAQTYVQITQTSVDIGFLFESMDYYSYISNYRTTTAILNIEYYKQFLRKNIYLIFLYEIDNIQMNQTISYSKISEILADAGSIASMLFLLSYLIVMINQSELQFEIVNGVISMFYPDFKDIKITKNIFGGIKKVEKNGRQLDLPQFKILYNKLSQIGEVKLTISNQIYEISRLQFLIQSLISKQYISQIHQRGLPLQINYQDTIKEEQQSIDGSINQDYQYKSNAVLPNIERIQELPSCQPTESKLIVRTNEQFLQVNQELVLTDGDFELLIAPQDEIFRKRTTINEKIQIEQS